MFRLSVGVGNFFIRTPEFVSNLVSDDCELRCESLDLFFISETIIFIS